MHPKVEVGDANVQHGLQIACDCGTIHTLTETQVFAIASMMHSRKARNYQGKALRKCPYCKAPMGTIELMVHKPKCTARPQRVRKPPQQRKIMRQCKYCGKEFSTLELKVHEGKCVL